MASDRKTDKSLVTNSVTGEDGEPLWNGDLTLLSRWLDLCEHKIPKVNRTFTTLIKRGYLITSRQQTVVSSAEQAASIVTTPPNFTFENPAKLWDATDKELTDAQKARFALGPDSLAEMHQSVVDTYLGWMAVGTADEWRLIADGNVHTLRRHM